MRAARSRAAATAGPGNYRRGLEAGGGACGPPYAAAGSAQSLSRKLLKLGKLAKGLNLLNKVSAVGIF